MMVYAHIVPGVLDKSRIKTWICFLIYAAVAAITLQHFVQLDSLPFLLGLIALPFSVTTHNDSSVSHSWLLASAACAVLAFFIPVKTILFFSVGFAGLFLLQWWAGKPKFLSAVTLFLMAPVFKYIADTFSFSIRLTLTQWVGKLIKLATPQSTSSKAVIYHNGNEFSVDPACMGLNMLVASLLLSAMFIGFYQRKSGTVLRWHILVFYMTLVVVLNIVSNSIRIFLLVHFAIMPEAAMHEIIGLLCLAVYVALPAATLAKYVVGTLGTKQRHATPHIAKPKLPVVLFLSLLTLIGGAFYTIKTSDSYSTFQHFANRKIQGYTVALHKPGILKVENNQALIYVKYVRGPYDTDHNPTLCWKGSGYNFEDVTTQHIDDYEIYTARLENGTETLYTAWCYSNGFDHTTSQWSWRRQMAQTKRVYAVVNVTAATPEALHKEATRVFKNHSLKALFSSPK